MKNQRNDPSFARLVYAGNGNGNGNGKPARAIPTILLKSIRINRQFVQSNKTSVLL